MAQPAPKKIPRLRLRLTAAAEARVRAGHPWVFAESIREANRQGEIGELAVIYDRNNRFLAAGLFDPESPIRMRILHVGKPQAIDHAWWSDRLVQAVHRRHGLFDDQTTGFRWVNGESDGWPGVVLDQYASTLALKLYTSAWLPRLSEVVAIFEEQFHPERIVLRLSRNIQEVAHRRFGQSDGDMLFGPPLDVPVIFRETGLRFEADVLRGQKTGFFLDQRENRRRVENLAKGRELLNAFSFSGGFSVYAARGGATAVTDLDISSHALASARKSFTLNNSISAVAACARESLQADAFEWLEQNSSRQFSLVILDPPSLARREAERAGALRAYSRLATLGLGHLSPGGILLCCSCSAHVTTGEFFEAVRKAASKSGRKFDELATATQPPDHPAAFKEAEYLKAIFLRVRQS
jgi:23S rRNA (cytosine1962-C5)-methyltransferase